MIGFFCLIVFVALARPSEAYVDINSPAPDFTLTDSTGQQRSLSDYQGKYVVLEWVNYDCPFVKKHYDSENMQNLQAQFVAQNVVWLSINSSAEGKQGNFTPQEINARIEEQSATPSSYLIDTDGTVGNLYEAQTTPHMFVVNPDGVLIYQGAIDSDDGFDPAGIADADNYVLNALNQAMSGVSVTDSETKSYGCSVKY